jgi:hypothetical protein
MKKTMIMIAAVLATIATLTGAENYIYFYNSNKDGDVLTLKRSDIVKINYSAPSASGIDTAKIYTADSTYTVLFTVNEAADSVMFAAPSGDDFITPGKTVDLGLSTKWASHNIDGTNPEDFGNYCGWGDPTGKNISTTKSEYPIYNTPKTICGTEYDMAKENWGNDWRLPKLSEMNELMDSCKKTYTTHNGVPGYKITGKNGNSIFLPLSGYRGGESVNEIGTNGYYWTGTLHKLWSDYGLVANLTSTSAKVDKQFRWLGCSTRAVKDASNVKVTTGTASEVTDTSATFTMKISGINGIAGAKAGILCDTEKIARTFFADTLMATPAGDGTFTISTKKLNPSAKYYFRAFAYANEVYYYGETDSITTPLGAVDLGLSVKWASCNVGATTPEGYGKYYGWGDPTGEKTSKSLSDYPSSTPPSTIVGTEYDMAKAQMGGNWQMPTTSQMDELMNNCVWTETTIKGVLGYSIKGPSGKSIFLPMTGWYMGTEFSGDYTLGEYWTGDINSNNSDAANCCTFSQYSSGSADTYLRYIRMQVRAVQPK